MGEEHKDELTNKELDLISFGEDEPLDLSTAAATSLPSVPTSASPTAATHSTATATSLPLTPASASLPVAPQLIATPAIPPPPNTTPSPPPATNLASSLENCLSPKQPQDLPHPHPCPRPYPLPITSLQALVQDVIATAPLLTDSSKIDPQLLEEEAGLLWPLSAPAAAELPEMDENSLAQNTEIRGEVATVNKDVLTL